MRTCGYVWTTWRSAVTPIKASTLHILKVEIDPKSLPVASSETQGFNGDVKGRERLEARKKDGGGEGEGERGSPGKLLYTDHFSINHFSELLLASFLIKFNMRPMKSDHTLIWKPLRTLELRTN